MPCEALLAPKLQHFVWDFSFLFAEHWDAFGIAERDWLLKFAQLAISRKFALRKIEIIFSPSTEEDDDINALWEQLEDNWPWDMMDEVRDAVSPHVEVKYIDPITREKFMELVNEYRLWAGANGRSQ